jgi:hypothetical protein
MCLLLCFGTETLPPGRGSHHAMLKASQAKLFFFEEKNQKTFATLVSESPPSPRPMSKSLFASFSEKEDSSFPVP